MVSGSLHSIAAHLATWIAEIKPGEWILFGAELLVALVIYLELEHSRDSAFLTTITSEKSDCERRQIYSAYLDESGTKEEKAEKLHQRLAAGDPIRTCCHNQIAMFESMGFEARRLRFVPWPRFVKRRYVSVFPHAPVFLWLIVRPYVRDRRSRTGPWFGHNALIFIERSISYVLKYRDELTLSLGDETKAIKLTRAEMEAMRVELNALISERPATWLASIRTYLRRRDAGMR